MMPLLAEKKSDYVIKDGKIYLTEKYVKSKKKFKKITGTRLGAVLGESKYTSPALVWADIVGIYKEDMDPMSLEAGNNVEPKVRDFIESAMKMRFKTYEPAAIGYDAFKEDECFGGVPDGEQVDEQGNFLYEQDGFILEVKTASKDRLRYKMDGAIRRPVKNGDGTPQIAVANAKLKEWFPNGLDKTPNVPIEYLYQLQLYMYLRNAKRGMLVVTFLEPEDYVNKAQSFDPAKRIVKAIGMKFDKAKFTPRIEQAKQWYEQHVKTGISPPLTEEDVKEWAH